MVDMRGRKSPETLFEAIEECCQRLLLRLQVVRPKRGERLPVPDAMQILEALRTVFRVEWVALDIVEEVAGCRTRHQVESLTDGMDPQFDTGAAGFPVMLKTRLGLQFPGRFIGKPWHALPETRKCLHGMYSGRLEFRNLALRDARNQVETVCGLPFFGTADSPAAKITMRARDRAGSWWCPDECLEAAACDTRMSGILRQAKTGPVTGAEDDMGPIRLTALHPGEQVGIEDQLKYVGGHRLSFQLRIRNLVGKRSEIGRNWYAFEEIRETTP